MKTQRHLQNRKCIVYCIAVRGGPSTATDNVYRKLVGVENDGPEIAAGYENDDPNGRGETNGTRMELTSCRLTPSTSSAVQFYLVSGVKAGRY